MTIFGQGRLVILIARELAQKYTKALALGFISGLVLSLGFWRVLPLVHQKWFTPVARIGMVGEFTPATLPPVVQNYLSAGLTTVAPDGSVGPGLATSWKATDSGKTFLFTIRPDAVWHTGKKIVAADVNYNIRNVTFSALDPHTLRAQLNAPYSPFPVVVAKPLFIKRLVGWGPYKVAAVTLHGDTVSSIRLASVSNEKTDVREYYFYKTEAQALLAYKLGEINEIHDLSSPYDLAGWGHTRVSEATNYSRIVSLYFNVTAPMLSDRSFRQALAFGTPLRGGVVPADSPVSSSSWAHTTKGKSYAYDAIAAKKLLGHSKESSVSADITISTFATYLDDAKSVAASWTDLGVPTQVKVVSSIPADYQVLLSAHDVPPDPDQYPLWHSTQLSTNITHFANVKIDKLLEDGRQEMNQTKRKTLYADFQRYLTEEVPAVFLYYPKTYTIIRK